MLMKRGRRRRTEKICRNLPAQGQGYRTSAAAGLPGPGQHILKFQGLRSEWLRPGGAELRPPVGWGVWPSASIWLGASRKGAGER